MSKKDVIKELRRHLADLFDSRFEGVDGVSHSTAQGFADGYMQALLDLALVEDREMLTLVNSERRSSVARVETETVVAPPGPALADFA